MRIAVLDSHALLVYFEGESGWETIAQLLAEATHETIELLMTVVNWGEVRYITERTYGEEKADEIMDIVDRLPLAIVEVDRELTKAAARLKARGGIAYADCFAAALAIQEGGEVVTGDPEFERVENDVSIRWIGR